MSSAATIHPSVQTPLNLTTGRVEIWPAAVTPAHAHAQAPQAHYNHHQQVEVEVEKEDMEGGGGGGGVGVQAGYLLSMPDVSEVCSLFGSVLGTALDISTNIISNLNPNARSFTPLNPNAKEFRPSSSSSFSWEQKLASHTQQQPHSSGELPHSKSSPERLWLPDKGKEEVEQPSCQMEVVAVSGCKSPKVEEEEEKATASPSIQIATTATAATPGSSVDDG